MTPEHSDLRSLLNTLDPKDPRRPSPRSDPRPSRPRRNLLDADALPRPERAGLGRRHRPADDVPGCASASRPVVGRVGSRALAASTKPSVDSVPQAHTHESGEGRHNDSAHGDNDGRLELRGLIENNRDHARRRRRTNEEAKDCGAKRGVTRHESIGLHSPILAHSPRAGEFDAGPLPP